MPKRRPLKTELQGKIVKNLELFMGNQKHINVARGASIKDQEISESTIYRILKEGSTPDIDTLYLLAKYFGKTVDDFLKD